MDMPDVQTIRVMRDTEGDRYACIEDLIRWAMLMQVTAGDLGNTDGVAWCSMLVDELERLRVLTPRPPSPGPSTT